MTGPDIRYAPVLKIKSFLDTLTRALDAVEAFEKQYDRFQDKKESVETHLAAWSSMLERIKNEKSMRENFRESALGKYNDARSIVKKCADMFGDDQKEIRLKQVDFQKGIKPWKAQKQLEAAFKTITGVFSEFRGPIVHCSAITITNSHCHYVSLCYRYRFDMRR